MSQADELVKYKQLLDQGVITQEEFEAEKAKILGSNNSQNLDSSQNGNYSNFPNDSNYRQGSNGSPKKKSPILGIIALITSLIFLHFISIPLAIIDIKKRGKNAISIIALVISTFWVIVIIAAIVTPDNNETVTSSTEISTTVATTDTTSKNSSSNVTEAEAYDKSEIDSSTEATTSNTPDNSQSKKETTTSTAAASTTSEQKAKSNDEYDYRNVLTDDTLRENFEAACKAINMNNEKIDLFSQVDDWAGGPRYTFDYKGKMYILYCNADSSISSISTKDLQKLYEEGYEPFSVDDYLAGKKIPKDDNRKKTQSDIHSETSSDGIITIKEGELGDYGKTVTLDGSDYINYYVPAGSYTVTNLGRHSTIYVASDKYYKNSDGYQENDIIDTIQLSENGQTAKVTVKEGTHIELVIASYVSLTPTK